MVTAIIVGAGHRAVGYANYALDFPEKLKIVGVADPSPERRTMTAKKFGLAPEQCYSSAEELAALPKQADAIINGTMDRQHVPTTIPLLERGYDVLLEKPFAVSIEEVEALSAAVRKTGRKAEVYDCVPAVSPGGKKSMRCADRGRGNIETMFKMV